MNKGCIKCKYYKKYFNSNKHYCSRGWCAKKRGVKKWE